MRLNVARARHRFAERFEREPQVAAVAPGRVNLIGDHTDYDGGCVLPLTLEQGIVVLAAPRSDAAAAPLGGGPAVGVARARGGASHAEGAAVLVHSTAQPDAVTLRTDAVAPRTGALLSDAGWGADLAGVLSGLAREGIAPGSACVLVDGDLPVGSGLSSSAALNVAFAVALAGLADRELAPDALVALALAAEAAGRGVPCGLMDPWAVVHGSPGAALLLDCTAERHQLVPLPEDVAVLVVDSGVRHDLADGVYAERRAQCAAAAAALGVPRLADLRPADLHGRLGALDPILARRARHVVSENTRTIEAADALLAGDVETAGALLTASHDSLRDDAEVSHPALDRLVDAALALGRERGVLGSRMTGGGFGGCTVTLTRRDALSRVRETLVAAARAGHPAAGASFTTRGAPGARRIEVPRPDAPAPSTSPDACGRLDAPSKPDAPAPPDASAPPSTPPPRPPP